MSPTARPPQRRRSSARARARRGSGRDLAASGAPVRRVRVRVHRDQVDLRREAGAAGAASRAASSSESLTPSHQRVLEEDRTAPREPGERRAARRAARRSGKRRFSGTSSSRTASVVACSDTARFTGAAVEQRRRSRGTTPAVETVTRRGASANAFGMRSGAAIASSTAGRLSSGSPMPMKTTLVIRRSGGERLAHAADLVDDLGGERLRVKPSAPVAQNEQASGQPTWVETQSVVRSSSGISTDSTRAPSRARSTPFRVPSAERRDRLELERAAGASRPPSAVAQRPRAGRSSARDPRRRARRASPRAARRGRARGPRCANASRSSRERMVLDL